MSRCTNTATTCQASCPQCTLDSECAQGRACVNNVCVDAGPESQCNSDKDCASSKFCAYGLCWNKQCVSNQDCPPRTFECQVTPAMRVGAGAGRAPVSPSGSTLTGAPSGTSGTQPTPIKATAGTCRAIQ
jgi:hypothetical protein